MKDSLNVVHDIQRQSERTCSNAERGDTTVAKHPHQTQYVTVNVELDPITNILPGSAQQ